MQIKMRIQTSPDADADQDADPDADPDADRGKQKMSFSHIPAQRVCMPVCHLPVRSLE